MFLKKQNFLNTGFLIRVKWRFAFYVLLATACSENLKTKHSLFFKRKRFCDSYQVQKNTWFYGKVEKSQ